MKLEKSKSWEIFFKNNDGNYYPNNFVIRLVLSYFKKVKYSERKKIKILDLGSGTGSNFFFLVDQNFTPSAIDKSKNAIKKLKFKIKKKNKDFKYDIKVSSFENLPFQDKNFEMIIDCTSLQHCKRNLLKRSLEEVNRVMKKNGCFISIYEKTKNNKNYDTNTYKINNLKNFLKKYFKKINVGTLDYNFGYENYKESFYIIQCIKK